MIIIVQRIIIINWKSIIVIVSIQICCGSFDEWISITFYIPCLRNSMRRIVMILENKPIIFTSMSFSILVSILINIIITFILVHKPARSDILVGREDL